MHIIHAIPQKVSRTVNPHTTTTLSIFLHSYNWNKYCQLHSLFNCASRSYKMNRAIRKNMFPEYIMSDHTPYEDVYTPRQTYTEAGQIGPIFVDYYCQHAKLNSLNTIQQNI